ncbi:MAG: L-threonylcarbamoyladenylate synthase [Thermoleophilaceae bacterium]
MTPEEVEEFERAIAAGGVGLFPADTVYGLACDPESSSAVERLFALKGRPATQPAAVMFFTRDSALPSLTDLGDRTRAAAERLLPGPFTLLVPNAAHAFPLACGPQPEHLGIRVPALDGALAQLAALARPVLQSSANPSGGPDPRRLDDVDEAIRRGADAVLDGGELPGRPSTVVDLTRFEETGTFEVVREGAVATRRVAELLGIV